jgi:hypothetical protein
MNKFIQNYIDKSNTTSFDSMTSADFTYSDSDNESSQFKLYQTLYYKYMEELDKDIKDIIDAVIEMEFNPIRMNEFMKKNLENSIPLLKQKKAEYEEMHALIMNDPETNSKTIERFILNYQKN